MNEPTPEQAAKLERITDPRQRRVLESAIARGEAIPDFAWTPVRPMTPEQESAINDLAQELLRRYGPRAADLIASLDLSDETESDTAKVDPDSRPRT